MKIHSNSGKRKVRKKKKEEIRKSRLELQIIASFLVIALIISAIYGICIFRHEKILEKFGTDGKIVSESGKTISFKSKEEKEKELRLEKEKKAAKEALIKVEREKKEYEKSHINPTKNALITQECIIVNKKIEMTVSSDKIVKSDDNKYHLFSCSMSDEFPDEINDLSTIKEISTKESGNKVKFDFDLNIGTDKSRLNKMFAVYVLYNGIYHKIGKEQYITNPEVLAYRTVKRNDHGKKGILPAVHLLNSNDLAQLGVKQCIYNVRLAELCNGQGVNYKYNGKTYSFNSGWVGSLDTVVRRLSSQGIQMTLVILNDSSSSVITHPKSRGARANYYAFNTAEDEGIARLSAAASFLADRYSGGAYGTIDNWIVGNEINARAEWHYMADVGVDQFTKEYAKAFRIFYNGIKSTNANARVYLSLDQQWSISQNNKKYYAGKDVLDLFNKEISSSGNIDWNVAYHPYNYPLTNSCVWQENPKVVHRKGTQIITMQNIDVLTDYLSRSEFLTKNGEVRSVLCSEVGYSSSKGAPLQASSLVFAYLQAENNRHIDGILISRELDDAGEVAIGMSVGIYRKLAWTYYQNIDTNSSQLYINQVSAFIGKDVKKLLTPR